MMKGVFTRRPSRSSKVVSKHPYRNTNRKSSDTASSKEHTSVTEREEVEPANTFDKSDSHPSMREGSPSESTTQTGEDECVDGAGMKSQNPNAPRLSRLRQVASSVSMGTFSPVAGSIPTPTTPALTPALTGTTDESDTDFRSAYSLNSSQDLSERDDAISVDLEQSFGCSGGSETDLYKARHRVSSVGTVSHGN